MTVHQTGIQSDNYPDYTVVLHLLPCDHKAFLEEEAQDLRNTPYPY
jgi:hypothetical protein